MTDPAQLQLEKAQAAYQAFIARKRKRKAIQYKPADHDADRLVTREPRIYPSYRRRFGDRIQEI